MISCNIDYLTDTDPLGGDATFEGCAESRLLMSRRDMMGLSVGLFTMAFAPRVASAAGAANPRLLIVLLRGGLDGLNVLPRFTNDYESARGTLALPKDEQITLGPGTGDFRLNGVMKNFADMYAKGNARIILPIAPPLQSRSHFDCSFNLENGTAGSARSDSGWLNRLFTQLPDAKKEILGAMPQQIGNTPVILTGPAPVLSWSPWSFSPNFFSKSAAKSLDALYAGTALNDIFMQGKSLHTAAGGLRDDNAYNDALQRSFIGAARLLGAADGPRVAVVTVDNFDAHKDEATNTRKVLANFDTSLGLFRDRAKSMGIWDSTLIVCVSEFGRTVTGNAAGGCDHGIGTTALLAGGAIRSSGITGDWPADLRVASQLGDNKDIKALYDTRDLFMTILREHFDIGNDSITARMLALDIFPGADSLPKGISYLRNLLA